MADVPLLTDGTVTLRAHRAEDVAAILEQCHDPASLTWTTVPRGYTETDAEEFVERVARAWQEPEGNRYWAIEVAGDDGAPRFGGTIDLRPGDAWDWASIGFGLHPAARGRGAMARAVRLVAAHAFETGPWGRPLARIHWRAIAGNWGSRRVAWATGFTMHGMLPGTHKNVEDPGGPGLDSWHGSLAAGDPMEPRTPWWEPKVLVGNGIRLRPWRDSDKDSMEPRNDPAHWVPPRAVLTPESFDRWLFSQRLRMADGQGINWCVADAETDVALGSGVLFDPAGPLTGDTAELGYQLKPSARGRGAAKEAARLMVEFACSPKDEGGLGLRRLVAQTAADNAASNHVLESQGFVVYGREHATDTLADGTYGDALHWECQRPTIR